MYNVSINIGYFTRNSCKQSIEVVACKKMGSWITNTVHRYKAEAMKETSFKRIPEKNNGRKYLYLIDYNKYLIDSCTHWR